jgi:hypothetical protein
MNEESELVERVIGFDSHPDSFTAACLRGPTPAAAVVEKIFNQVPMDQLPRWVQKHTRAQDLIVLEAAGNSFQVVRTLAAVGRQAKVLESCQMGKLKEAHANHDQISAVRIGKAYLAGTAISCCARCSWRGLRPSCAAVKPPWRAGAASCWPPRAAST